MNSVSSLFDEYNKFEEHDRLVRTGRISKSGDVDAYRKYTGTSSDNVNRIKAEEDLADETLALTCAILWEKAHKICWIEPNILQLYHQERNTLFNRDTVFEHICGKKQCSTRYYEPGQFVQHPFTLKLIGPMSGTVFVCDITGNVHICNKYECNAELIVSKGWNVCPISSRPIMPEHVFTYNQKKSKDWNDYGSSGDDEGVKFDEQDVEADADSDSDSEQNQYNDIEIVNSSNVKKISRPIYEEASVTEFIEKIETKKTNALQQIAREKDIQERKKRQRVIAAGTDYNSYAKEICKSVLQKVSRRQIEIQRLTALEMPARNAFFAVLEKNPYDLEKAMIAYYKHFDIPSSRIHPSIINPEFSNEEVSYYAKLLIYFWNMLRDTKLGRNDSKSIDPKLMFNSMFHILESGFSTTLVVEKATGLICKSTTINRFNMDHNTMKLVTVHIVGKHHRLSCMSNKFALKSKSRSYININNGIKKIKACFNSKIDETIFIKDLLEFTLSHYCK